MIRTGPRLQMSHRTMSKKSLCVVLQPNLGDQKRTKRKKSILVQYNHRKFRESEPHNVVLPNRFYLYETENNTPNFNQTSLEQCGNFLLKCCPNYYLNGEDNEEALFEKWFKSLLIYASVRIRSLVGTISLITIR